MIPHPTAASLHLCERVIVEERTKNVTLVNMFTTLNFAEFPATPRSIYFYAALVDGLGMGFARVRVTMLEEDVDVYMQRIPVTFPRRLGEVHISFRIERLDFPQPGTYMFSLDMDGVWIANRRLIVRRQEMTT